MKPQPLATSHVNVPIFTPLESALECPADMTAATPKEIPTSNERNHFAISKSSNFALEMDRVE
jgi:hypothetical protein